MSEGSHGAAMVQTVRHVPPNLRSGFEAHVAASECREAPDLVLGGRAIATLQSLWRRVPRSQQGALLAEAISRADFLAPHLPFLLRALRSIRERGERVFDGRLARTRFAQLPDRVTAYRGAVQAETAVAYGISWTLDRARAVSYTTSRTRNWMSPAVLLTASVARDDIAGMLLACGDSELLLLEPEYTVSAIVENLQEDNAVRIRAQAFGDPGARNESAQGCGRSGTGRILAQDRRYASRSDRYIESPLRSKSDTTLRFGRREGVRRLGRSSVGGRLGL